MGLIFVCEGRDMICLWSLYDGKLSEKRGMLGIKYFDICFWNWVGGGGSMVLDFEVYG